MPVISLSAKSMMNDQFYRDKPASLYNIEYTPKLMARRTTGYAKLDRNNPLEEK